MRFFEEMAVGQRRELGSFTFTADAIKRFAAQFDPQRFHLDEEEGRKSLFGGLAASGWHVGSVCMKLLVADAQRQAPRRARGEEMRGGGPRRVSATCAGSSRCWPATPSASPARSWRLRTSESRPEWGIVQVRNTGTNQRGELVYSILGTAFVPRGNAVHSG